jgi:hypothetical protein
VPARRWLRADTLITLGFLALFAWAIWQARAWPYRAALFPVLVSLFAFVPILVKLWLDSHPRPTTQLVPTTSAGVAAHLVEEQEATDAELEDIFETAPRKVWLNALGWLALFFVMLWALGIYITVPLFALVYLLVVSRDSLPIAAGYAALAWAFLYFLFDQVLHLPLPTSAVVTLLGL